jgi:hypothetical protein
MIWALAREQMRSQWRYVLSAGIVITVAVGLAAYAGLMALTLGHSQATLDHFMGLDRETFADATTDTYAEFDALAAHIDQANEDGHNVVGQASVWASLGSSDPWGYSGIVALYGDLDWSDVMVEGAAPQSGEVAVSAQWASSQGVAIGDDVPLVTAPVEYGKTIPLDATLRVSGLTRSSVGTAAVQIYAPDAWVAWEDVPTLNQAWTNAVSGDSRDSGSVGEGIVSVTIYGDGDWPWNTELATAAWWNRASENPAASIAIISGIGFAALVIGLIAMAFALGRAQAQARTKWLGTVRAMGASKRQVAAASLLESVVVGVLAGAAGFILGALAALAHFAVIAARVASPMILAAPAGYAGVAAAALLLAILLALIVGAVPAFWAARVSPTAALKPVNDLSEATVSRHVRVWPLTVTWFVAAGLVASGFATTMFSAYAVVVLLATVVLAVTSIMLAHEVLRHTIPWHAKRLSQSRRRAVMVAGDAILARPRQSTIPAFIVALATTVVLALMGQLVASWSTEMAHFAREGDGSAVAVANPYVAPLPLMGVYAVVALLCVAVGLATASVTSREAATRRALGLTSAQGRLAAALQYLVGQAHGLALGLIGGALGVAGTMAVGMPSPMLDIAAWWSPLAQFFGLTILIAALWALVGAAIAGAFAPKTAPLSRVEVSA